MHQRRITLENPSIDDVADAIDALRADGAPTETRIRFRAWNNPPTNFYLIATWLELDDGTFANPELAQEFG